MMRSLRSYAFLVGMSVFGLFAMAQMLANTRILAPRGGEKISNTFVNVKYQLTAPVSAESPARFRVQLNSRDPVETNDMQYDFTGLTPGQHTVSVEAIDANGTPISGTRTQVQFTVMPQDATATPRSGTAPKDKDPTPTLMNVTYQGPPQTEAPVSQQDASNAGQPRQSTSSLPNTGSALPLLSIIGMGVLVGGIASAMRTRQSRTPR